MNESRAGLLRVLQAVCTVLLQKLFGLLNNLFPGVFELSFHKFDNSGFILYLIEELIKSIYRMSERDVAALGGWLAMHLKLRLFDFKNFPDNFLCHVRL